MGSTLTDKISLLRFIKSDDELALIIGHEIAHNALNHVGRMRGIGTIGGVAGILLDIGMAAAGVHTGGVLSRTGHNAARLVFSKEFEMEADYLGLYLAARAGFDISKAPNFFRRMAVEYTGSITENFLSSHPSTPERSMAMESTVKEIQTKAQTGEPLTPRRIETVKNQVENAQSEQRLVGE
jgi:predicted Zn-dependent protease